MDKVSAASFGRTVLQEMHLRSTIREDRLLLTLLPVPMMPIALALQRLSVLKEDVPQGCVPTFHFAQMAKFANLLSARLAGIVILKLTAP